MTDPRAAPHLKSLLEIQGLGDSAQKNVFEARMQRDIATQLSLQRHKGNSIEVSGEIVDPGASGLTRLTTDNRIDATGADAGAALVASTLYHAYVSNSAASFSPSSIRIALTAPSLLKGVKYLGTSGNAANWRFVGWVFTNSSTQLEDNSNARHVVNYYNRRWVVAGAAPGGSNDNLATSYTTASSTWVAANSGSGNLCSFISNGEDDYEFAAWGSMDNSLAAGTSQLGLSEGGITTVRVSSWMQSTDQQSVSLRYVNPFAEGRHTLELVTHATGGSTATYFADNSRSGSSLDPVTTAFSGLIPV